MPQECRVQVARVEKATDGAEPMDMEEEAAYEVVVEEEETVTVGASHYRGHSAGLSGPPI
jgi:hypothetical protein